MPEQMTPPVERLTALIEARDELQHQLGTARMQGWGFAPVRAALAANRALIDAALTDLARGTH